ncbi:MAG: adenylate/guanylate cyclase domain-containing protein [Actinomycetota bacterium]
MRRRRWGGESAFDGQDIADADLTVRIGLASGQPVDHNDDIYGEAVVLASRLCDAAESHQILVSEAVHEEVGSDFEFSTRLSPALKGFSEPVAAFELRIGGVPGTSVGPIETPRPSLWRRLFGSRN